jgi:hypothetical protein
MSGLRSLSQIPTISRLQLSPGERASLIAAQNRVRGVRTLDELEPFLNNKEARSRRGPSPLPRPALGCAYYEFDAGQDRDGGRGSHRFVFEINRSSREIKNIFYTDEHYAKRSFTLVLG